MLGSFSALELLVGIALNGVATFLAIHLWSKTREPAWLLLIIAVVAWFGEHVFSGLIQFGIVTPVVIVLGGVDLFPLVLRALPWCFMIAALWQAIRAADWV